MALLLFQIKLIFVSDFDMKFVKCLSQIIIVFSKSATFYIHLINQTQLSNNTHCLASNIGAHLTHCVSSQISVSWEAYMLCKIYFLLHILKSILCQIFLPRILHGHLWQHLNYTWHISHTNCMYVRNYIWYCTTYPQQNESTDHVWIIKLFNAINGFSNTPLAPSVEFVK